MVAAAAATSGLVSKDAVESGAAAEKPPKIEDGAPENAADGAPNIEVAGVPAPARPYKKKGRNEQRQ